MLKTSFSSLKTGFNKLECLSTVRFLGSRYIWGLGILSQLLAS
jgi:hypothetical protein